MGRKSCDTCLDPGKLQDLKEYPNPKDPEISVGKGLWRCRPHGY